MRFLAVSVVVCMLTYSGLAQTARELEAKFGHPNSNGYTVAPDVRLTVTYGDDNRACSLSLQSTNAKSGPVHQQPNFDADIADRVLNEIAPPATRKGTPRKMAEQMGCALAVQEEYDNVSVARVTAECLPLTRKNVQSLTITWKRPACK